MTPELKIVENEIHAFSDYHPHLPSRAKNLGGRWNGSCWRFDVRDIDAVKNLYTSIYGTDGTAPTGDLVTGRCTIENDDWTAYQSGLFLFGRQVAYATGRDSGARLSAGVVILKGGFTSGGSAKNWRTVGSEGTIFEMRDLPRGAVSDAVDCISCEVVEQTIGIEKLRAEKQALLDRIAEIDKLIGV